MSFYGTKNIYAQKYTLFHKKLKEIIHSVIGFDFLSFCYILLDKTQPYLLYNRS